MYKVYIIKSRGHNWYYVGSTKNLDERIKEHNNGNVRSTKSKSPLDIVYTEEYTTQEEALKRERQIKSQRMLKEKIIRNAAPSSNG